MSYFPTLMNCMLYFLSFYIMWLICFFNIILQLEEFFRGKKITFVQLESQFMFSIAFKIYGSTTRISLFNHLLRIPNLRQNRIPANTRARIH